MNNLPHLSGEQIESIDKIDNSNKILVVNNPDSVNNDRNLKYMGPNIYTNGRIKAIRLSVADQNDFDNESKLFFDANQGAINIRKNVCISADQCNITAETTIGINQSGYNRNLIVNGNSTINGNLTVNTNATFNGSTNINGNIKLTDDIISNISSTKDNSFKITRNLGTSNELDLVTIDKSGTKILFDYNSPSIMFFAISFRNKPSILPYDNPILTNRIQLQITDEDNEYCKLIYNSNLYEVNVHKVVFDMEQISITPSMAHASTSVLLPAEKTALKGIWTCMGHMKWSGYATSDPDGYYKRPCVAPFFKSPL